MPEILRDLVRLPLGSHCVSFHASREEAAAHATDFLAGSPPWQAAAYWVADPDLRARCQDLLAARAPHQVGCVMVLEKEQVHPIDGRLRPVDEIQHFVGSHPDGVTGGADTISEYWRPENVPEHLEYEGWFDQQPRDHSRFLCPYDLRKVPPEEAPKILRQLGAHHSHAVLSSSPEAGVRLLQLFVFATPSEVPSEIAESLEWALREGLVAVGDPPEPLSLTDEGNRVVQEWSRHATVDW